MIQLRHKKKMESEGLFFYHPNRLCCLDQMLAVMELNQHLVSLSKTVRSIIPRGARCVGHAKIMWSVVCSLALHSHFAEEARLRLCTEELKRPMPVRTRFSLTQAALVKLSDLCNCFRAAGTNGCLDFILSLLAAWGSVSWPCGMWPGSEELPLAKRVSLLAAKLSWLDA